MEPYLAKACRRAVTKLAVGLALLGALVGLRFVTATPRGIEAEIAELERYAAAAEAGSGTAGRVADAAGHPAAEASSGRAAASADAVSSSVGGGAWAAADLGDPDRLVKCRFGGERPYMRAADCETRGGQVEELPPPSPDEAASRPADR